MDYRCAHKYVLTMLIYFEVDIITKEMLHASPNFRFDQCHRTLHEKS